MKIAEDGRRVEYEDYGEYLAHQAMRRNVLSEDNPAVFNPHDHPGIVKNLQVFYQFVEPAARILDIGCRSGWSCLRMSYDGYDDVLGIDVQADNIEFGRAWGASIQPADAHLLPYDDETFDAVFTRHALEHMFDPARVIQEAYRVLRPNGVFFAVVPIESQITGFDFAHSYAFESPERLLELTGIFRKVYSAYDGYEATYVGMKSGDAAQWCAMRLKGIVLQIGHLGVHALGRLRAK